MSWDLVLVSRGKREEREGSGVSRHFVEDWLEELLETVVVYISRTASHFVPTVNCTTIHAKLVNVYRII